MGNNATDLGINLVKQTLNIVAETAGQYRRLEPTKLSCHPLPYFGPISAAKVITLGLNPSSHELRSERNWPLQIEPSRLAARLTTYFSCEQARPHPWCQPWSTIMSELGLCYSKDAAHIDLSPRSTNSSRSNLKDLFVEMLQTDAAIWVEALTRAASCEFVLAAGSATKDVYINEFICQKLGHAGVRLVGDWRRRSGEGQTALHKIILPSGREIPFFFCSSGPSKSNGAALVDACRSNMSLLRRLSSGSKHSREGSC